MNTPIAIYFATMTGNAEGLALQARDRVQALGLSVTLHNLADVKPAELGAHAAQDGAVSLFFVSTWGDGEPPADACDFHYDLQKEVLALGGSRHAVFGLGDKDYQNFNAFARELDARVLELGSTALLPRFEADLDFEDTFAGWLEELVTALSNSSAASVSA